MLSYLRHEPAEVSFLNTSIRYFKLGKNFRKMDSVRFFASLNRVVGGGGGEGVGEQEGES